MGWLAFEDGGLGYVGRNGEVVYGFYDGVGQLFRGGRGGIAGLDLFHVAGELLKSVEDGYTLLHLDLVGGNGSDSLGESHLEGIAVLDGSETDALAGFEEVVVDVVGAELAVVSAEVGVEVAKTLVPKSRGLASLPAHPEMAADGEWHVPLSFPGGTPRWEK